MAFQEQLAPQLQCGPGDLLTENRPCGDYRVLFPMEIVAKGLFALFWFVLYLTLQDFKLE